MPWEFTFTFTTEQAARDHAAEYKRMSGMVVEGPFHISFQNWEVRATDLLQMEAWEVHQEKVRGL
jgi:hypothetical protein